MSERKPAKSYTIRVSAEFLAELESIANKRRRTLAGQCEQAVAVYQAVTQFFRHDEVDLIIDEIRKWKAASEKPHCSETPKPITPEAKKKPLHHAV